MTETKSGLSKYASLAVRLAAVWLLVGAVFKLFWGTPSLLPPFVREHTPFGLDLTFHLAIAIELSIVCACFLKPRFGWPFIATLFGFFLIVLTNDVLRGEKSCGCFGSKVNVPPAVMMVLDGSLLAFVLATKPWSSLTSAGLPTLLLVIAIAASWAAPWLLIQSGDAGVQITRADDGTVRTNVKYVVLEPEKWIGKTIFDVEEFTRWVPVDKIPTDGRIVLWRQGCDHCAQHLREMANEKDLSQPILLVQVQDDLKSSRAVDAMPSGGNVTQVALPENLDFLLTTPLEIRIEGGVVKSVIDRDAIDKAATK
jgi:hypothetical protein